MIFSHFLTMIWMVLVLDDAFFQPELGWRALGVVGPDLDCWWAGLQAPGSFGLR